MLRKTETPIIFVGTKIDLREQQDTITLDNALKYAIDWRERFKFPVISCVECSAKKNLGVIQVFEEVVRVVRKQPEKTHPKFTGYLPVPKKKSKGVFASISDADDMNDLLR